MPWRTDATRKPRNCAARTDGRSTARSVLIPLYDARERHVGFGNLTRDLAGSAVPETAAPEPDLAVRRGAQQILVVDDDDQVRASRCASSPAWATG